MSNQVLVLSILVLAGPVMAGAMDPGASTLGPVGEGMAPAGSVAQSATRPDSARILREARRAQEDFERFRETRIPAEISRGVGRCDEPIGRLCLVYGDGSEPSPIRAAPRPVADARRELLAELAEAARELPGDRWIAGVRVHYLLEADDLLGARQVVEQCGAEPWWCSALQGLVLHHADEWVDAGEAFLDALERMPRDEADGWTGEHWVLEREGRSFLDVRDAGERERRRALLWRLADPFFMVPGNDRWTEHMSRLTQVRILEDAWNPFGLEWDEDLEQILVRYGWALGWERARGLTSMRQMGQIQENRMTARLDPDRRRFLPTGEVLEAFPATGEGGLDIRGHREPTGHTPSYARRTENLSSQTGRFLRDGQLLVLHAFAPATSVGEEVPTAADDDDLFGGPPPMGRGAALPVDLRTGIFLLPVVGPVVEDGPRPLREGQELEGVWSAAVPRGDYILSTEAWSRLESRAWRARIGLADLPRPEGSLAASDPIFLDPDVEPLPESLDDALESMVPTVSFGSRARVRIGWEVYGLSEGDVATVSLGLEQAERSFLRRLGEFFRVLEPIEPVVIRWDEGELERPGTVFRAVDLQLPELGEGVYDLFLEIGVGEGSPAVARRRFEVTDGG